MNGIVLQFTLSMSGHNGVVSGGWEIIEQICKIKYHLSTSSPMARMSTYLDSKYESYHSLGLNIRDQT